MKPESHPGAPNDAIDSILAADDPLVPSSGFLAGVMERVREEAIVPQPIPFPWKRALPAMVLVAGTIVWLIYEFIRTALAGEWQIAFNAPHLPAAELNLIKPALWIALSLGFPLVSWAISRRLTRNSSLL